MMETEIASACWSLLSRLVMGMFAVGDRGTVNQGGPDVLANCRRL